MYVKCTNTSKLQGAGFLLALRLIEDHMIYTTGQYSKNEFQFTLDDQDIDECDKEEVLRDLASILEYFVDGLDFEIVFD